MPNNKVAIGVFIAVVILVILLLAVFWDSCCLFSGSSPNYRRGCYDKYDCDTSCYSCAEVCGVTRTLIQAGNASDQDEYQIIVTGEGLTSTTITEVTLNIANTAGGTATSTTSFTPTATDGNRIVYTSNGRHLILNYHAGLIDGGTGNPVASGNMSATITYSLSATVLTLNAVLPVNP